MSEGKSIHPKHAVLQQLTKGHDVTLHERRS